MATLTFNGTTQYTEFNTLSGGLDSVASGSHTCVALVRRTSIGIFTDPFAVTNGALNLTFATAKYANTNAVAYDVNRSGGSTDLLNHNSTTIWAMIATTLQVADTPDTVLHFRDHTANATWTHTNGGDPGSPGAGFPGAAGLIQHGRWQNTDFWTGQIGVAACWNIRLSSAQLDELFAHDKTSDWWNCSAGRPLHLVEFNVPETSLVDLTGNSLRSAPAAAPALTGPDPDRWTFDGMGLYLPYQPRRMPLGV